MSDAAPATGATPSERYLGELCRKSFLRLWSYQNVFTDRGVTRSNRQGKELCDLLVVFENDILIFSDKSCAMPETQDVWKDWSRWYRRAIHRSAEQIYGAERWLARFPSRIFTDKECSQPFPLPLPSVHSRRIHRIVVALGSSRRVETFFGGNGRGSLMLANWLRRDDHVDPDVARIPFQVGQVDPDRGYVHVFDDVTLNIIMNELDTVSDFVAYLNAKTDLMTNSLRISCAGEEDLLGFYLEHVDPAGNFTPPQLETAKADPGLMIHIAEGIWDDFSASPNADFRRQMKKAGAFVDGLLDNVTSHVLAGTLAFGADDTIAQQERNLRFLAAEPRHWRAMFATCVAQKVATTPPNLRTSMVVGSTHTDRLFVFLLFPRSGRERQRSYRLERQAAATAYCHVVKHLNPSVRFVICLATEPGDPRRGRSEDIVSFDFEEWTAEADADAARVQKEMHILTDVVERQVWEPPNVRRGDLIGGNRHERRRAKAIARPRGLG